jgi:hypothetical protein
MENIVPTDRPAVASRVQIADIIALVASAAILVGYAALPLRTDSAATGFSFIDSATTFPALTLVVGIVGVISALVSIVALRERAIRWWFVGLGILGLVFLLDNTLRQKAALSSGGWIAMLGSAVLVLQAALPRANAAAANRTQEIVLGLVRISLATLWLTQLLWKLPWHNYGCAAGALVPATGTSGLCDWIGREIASPRWPAYKSFLEGFVTPNLSWLALLIVAGEALVAMSLMLGLLTRVGALTGTLMAINLFVGLTAVPAEWDWTYLMLIALNAVFIVVGGRFVGLDALLYLRFKRIAESGGLAGLLLVRLVS